MYDTPTVPTTPPPPGGVLRTIGEKLRSSEWIEQFDVSTCHLVQMATYAGFGFVAGFVLAKCGRLLLTGALIVTFLCLLLVYTGVMVPDFAAIAHFLGIAQISGATVDQLLMMLYSTLSTNISLVISFIVGMILGRMVV